MLKKIIDFHVHPLQQLTSPNALLEDMKKNSINHAVLLAMDLDKDIIHHKNVKKNIHKRIEYTAVMDIKSIYDGMHYMLHNGNTPNDYVANIVEGEKNRFTGFGSVHVGHKSKKYIRNKLKEIKLFVDEMDFKGIKLLPTLQFFNPETCKNLPLVFNFAEKYDLSILYHTGCDPGPWELPLLSNNGNPLLLEKLIKRHDKLKIILAHLGSYSATYPGIWLKEALYLVKNYNNAWGDISAVPYLLNNNKSTNQIIEAMGNDLSRLLYGSDYPIVNLGFNNGLGVNINSIWDNDSISDYAKENLFYYNAKNILNL